MPDCPFCGEPVRKRQKKCRACDEELIDESGDSVFGDDDEDDEPEFDDDLIEVVGESHYQDALASALKEFPDRYLTVLVKCEPTNAYDPNAIVIRSADDTTTFGYLPRNKNQFYHRVVAEKSPLTVAARLFGGQPGKPSIGIMIDGAALRPSTYTIGPVAPRAHDVASANQKNWMPVILFVLAIIIVTLLALSFSR